MAFPQVGAGIAAETDALFLPYRIPVCCQAMSRCVEWERIGSRMWLRMLGFSLAVNMIHAKRTGRFNCTFLLENLMIYLGIYAVQ